MAHVTGQLREQTSLFPETLDEAVGADHAVRVIDAFVDSLDLAQLGFSKVVAEATGRPPYNPGDLLKLYVYGYLNRVRSSRRLAVEARRNIEVMWLTHRAAPAFKTIADFRKDHPQAIVGVCRAFVRFCREQALVGGELLAIDGTKIDAVASRKQVVTAKDLEKAAAAMDRKIAAYLAQMDEADRDERTPETDGVDVTAAVAALRARRAEIQQQAEALSRRGLSQWVRTEPEAKLMRTARHGHQVAYNAQTVVDGKHKLVVACDLTNDGNDQCQLHPMAVAGRDAVDGDKVTVVADAGYSNGEHGQRCADDGIIAIVPRAETVNPEGKKYFTRDQFSYDADSDSWRCPAGETLTHRETSWTEQKKRYGTTACADCALKPKCTQAAKRIIIRHFYEDARQAMHQRAMSDPKWMALRRMLVEHPYGTIKWMMGHPRFLVRGLKKAKSELALSVLGYNLKRVINIMGVPALLQALRPFPV
jgi:transposase